ncbi:MAG: hypothetical protein F6K17_33355 [Okeania sp. SIO3C4]|nr:hypothetical protein [Okeania sp. SIO3C4]
MSKSQLISQIIPIILISTLTKISRIEFEVFHESTIDICLNYQFMDIGDRFTNQQILPLSKIHV